MKISKENLIRSLLLSTHQKIMSGIFITKGMHVSIPVGGFQLSIDEAGKPAGSLTLHLRYDVCPTWIEIARSHLARAEVAREQLLAAWTGSDDDAKRLALEREFEASMQAIVSAAVAIDAFYAILKPMVALPEVMRDGWKKGRTARHKQIKEVIRRAFKLGPKTTEGMGIFLQQVFRLRDQAVHPHGESAQPIIHPAIGVAVEHRFSSFRLENARTIVESLDNVLKGLCRDKRPKKAAVAGYIATLAQRLQIEEESSG